MLSKKHKRDTTGMKDMFEQAIKEIEARIQEQQDFITSLEQNANKYDSGLGDIEDRNDRIAALAEIRRLEEEREKLLTKER